MNSILVGEKLQEWAKKMGYTPGAKFTISQDYTDALEFSKLCKGGTKDLWQQVVQKVDTVHKLDHIRKNLILKRIKEGEMKSKHISGLLGQQIALSNRLQSKLIEREKIAGQVQNLELSVSDKEKMLRKSVCRCQDSRRCLGESLDRMMMLRMKKEEFNTTIQFLQDLTEVANELCPAAPHAKPSQAKSPSSPLVFLRNCMDLIKKFNFVSDQNSKDTLGSIEDQDESAQQRKAIWKSLTSNVVGWGVQHLWHSITAQLMDQFLSEISNSASTVDLHADAERLNKSIPSVLPAFYFYTFLETVHYKLRAAIINSKLLTLKNKVSSEIQDTVSSSTLNMTMSSNNCLEQVQTWVDLKTKRVQLTAVREAIQADINGMRDSCSDVDSRANQIQEKNDVIAKLDSEIAIEKKQVEYNFNRMKSTASRLKLAASRVMQQLENFKQQQNVVDDSVAGSTGSSDQVLMSCRTQLRKPNSLDVSLDASIASDRGRAPLSSTMLGNLTAGPGLLSFDTTAISLDSGISTRSDGQNSSTISEAVSILREAMSKEAKMFFKLPLETVPTISVGADDVAKCRLMVHAPVLVPPLASSPIDLSQKLLLQLVPGVPVSSAPLIILQQLQKQSHFRALHICQTVNRAVEPPALFAPLRREHLEMVTPEQENKLLYQLKEISVKLDGIQKDLASCKDNLQNWFDRPIEQAVLGNDILHGKTFKEWRKTYDTLLKQAMA